MTFFAKQTSHSGNSVASKKLSKKEMSLRSSQKINESQSSTTPRLILDKKAMNTVRQLSTGALFKRGDDTESEDNTH